MKRIFLFLSALLSIAAGAGADVLEPAHVIASVPAVIKKPGTYVIDSNLVLKGTTGCAITINASNVVLDLGEKTITNELPAGATTTSAYGVYSDTSQSNVTVRNGSLENFYDGLYIYSGTAGRLVAEKVSADNSGNAGIELTGDIVDISDCHVSRCQYNGIVGAGNEVTVSNCEAFFTNNGTSGNGTGIEVDGLVCALVSKCRVWNFTPGLYGINIPDTGFAVDNTIEGFSFGLFLAGGTAVKYLNNLTVNCTTSFSGGTAATGNN